ncbi:MAG: HD domain-containing protein [Fusobacteriaceae bacterium]
MTTKSNVEKQFEFLVEIDKVKGILRQTLILNGHHQENDAEHSWHMAMSAFILKEYFCEPFDLEKTFKMILIHDIVEIYAGDTPCYGEKNPNKFDEEMSSAKKIFSLLPENQYQELMNIWLEFEEMKSSEAKFANACDRFQGFIQNITSDGHTWKKYKVKKSQVLKRLSPVIDFMPKVFEEVILPQIEKYFAKGIILPD